MSTYYYIGGAAGSMNTAADWSLSSGGEALASITWADGDTAVVDTDATITHNLSYTSTAAATGTSGLLVTGTGTPVFVLTGTAAIIGETNTNRTIGTSATPFVLPNCRCQINLVGASKNTVTAHLKIVQNTIFTNLAGCYSTYYFYADSARTLPVLGNIYRGTSGALGGITFTFSNITAFELCGEGTQHICATNQSAGQGMTADTPIVINKTSGAVNLVQSSVAAAANSSHDPLVVSGSCPTIYLNDTASAYAAGYSSLSGTPGSFGPIQLAGDLTCDELILNNGVSATYPTIIQVPSGTVLSSGSTSWGSNCLIDGANSTYGTYCTSCTGGIQDDSADANYNVAEGIATTCRVSGVTSILTRFESQITLSAAAVDSTSPVRLAELLPSGAHLPSGGTAGTCLIFGASGPEWGNIS